MSALDRVVQRAYTAGLLLARSAAVDAVPPGLVHDVTELLDSMVKDLRDVAEDLLPLAGRSRGGVDAAAVVDRLRGAADDLRLLAAESARNGGEPVHIGEAEHSVRRAVVVLHDDLMQPSLVVPQD